MSVEVRRCSIAEIRQSPNFSDLMAEYAQESSLPELGRAEPQMDTYFALEASGKFHPIGAFSESRVVGFILPIVIVLPHYGVLAATVESFFVTLAARASGVGLKLLAAAEQLARDLGAKALLLSAPVGGQLAKLLALPVLKYRHSNETYIKGLA